MKMFLLAFVLPLASAYYGSSDYPPPPPPPPTTCPENIPPECDIETQMVCSGGKDSYTGCPFPDFCTDMFDSYSKDNDGNPCPKSCPVMCDYANDEMWCPGGSYNGCYSPGYCMPGGQDENGCWASCPMNCAENEILCPGWTDSYTGCHMGDHCVAPYGDCPAMCAPNCDYMNGEQWCDNGYDENSCWMGAYCAAKGIECVSTTAA